MNSIINRSGLREVYARKGAGQRNRTNLRITVQTHTYSWLAFLVPVGRGQFGSAFCEVAIRFLLALVSDGEYLEQVVLELLKIEQSPYLVNNMIRVLKIMGVPIRIGDDTSDNKSA